MMQDIKIFFLVAVFLFGISFLKKVIEFVVTDYLNNT